MQFQDNSCNAAESQLGRACEKIVKQQQQQKIPAEESR